VRCRGCGFCRVGKEVMGGLEGRFCGGMSGGMVIYLCEVVQVSVWICGLGFLLSCLWLEAVVILFCWVVEFEGIVVLIWCVWF